MMMVTATTSRLRRPSRKADWFCSRLRCLTRGSCRCLPRRNLCSARYRSRRRRRRALALLCFGVALPLMNLSPGPSSRSAIVRKVKRRGDLPGCNFFCQRR
jgi:hypothetical protein